MRIEFPNSARDDFFWTQSVLRIGSAPDNDLVLAAQQAAAHHARIQQDRRGLVLQVLPDCGRVYVNARPVRERALLRPGDILSVGDCRMLLRADEAPELRQAAFLKPTDCPTAALRAVAGPLSGRVMPIHGRLRLGQSGSQVLELPQGDAVGLEFSWRDGQLALTVEPVSERNPLRLNGVIVSSAILLPGDQLGLAHHRFILDAPGLEPEPVLQPTTVAGDDALAAAVAAPRGEGWWLILTAAVLALGIALVLLIRL
jgi:pSer/pThr/pTyr-binding forkhead associated (FHA) protein